MNPNVGPFTKSPSHVGKYTSTMEPMGICGHLSFKFIWLWKFNCYNVWSSDNFGHKIYPSHPQNAVHQTSETRTHLKTKMEEENPENTYPLVIKHGWKIPELEVSSSESHLCLWSMFHGHVKSDGICLDCLFILLPRLPWELSGRLACHRFDAGEIPWITFLVVSKSLIGNEL